MNWRKHKTAWSVLLSVLTFLVIVNVVFLFYSPDQIVDYIGIENTYLTIFLIATIGGMNSLTSGVLYSTLLAFAAGGADPLLLGLMTGLGISLGDIIMFTLFRYGYQSFPQNWQARIEQYSNKFTSLSQSGQYILVYAYLAFSPFPNDIMMFFLVTLRYSYQQIIPLTFFGGVTFATLLSYFGESWWG